MAGSEFFSITGLEEGIKELTGILDEIDTSVKSAACKKAVEGGADIILKEEKRILSNHPKYVKFVPWLSSAVYKSGDGYVAACGYSTEVLQEHIEPLIIEFGRGSGRRAVKRGGKDKRGRRIGAIQPYSHIRAAWFNKKDEAQKFVGDYIFDEIRKAWVKKNG